MKEKKNKRVPWHVTLFSGGLFLLLFKNLAGIFAILFGLLYVFYPKFRKKQDDGSGPPE